MGYDKNLENRATICKLQAEELFFIKENILDGLFIKNDVLGGYSILDIVRPDKIEIPSLFKYKIAAIEFLEALGYSKGKHDNTVKCYLKPNIKTFTLINAKEILNYDTCPNLCELLEISV